MDYGPTTWTMGLQHGLWETTPLAHIQSNSAYGHKERQVEVMKLQ